MAENGSEASDISQSSDPIKEEDNSSTQQERDDQSAGSCDQAGLPRRSSLIKDVAKKRSRKKTVSFSSFPEEKPISKATDCLSIMEAGSELVKIRSPSRQYNRFFALSEDRSELRWHSSSKKPEKARISVESIKEVRLGKTTENFRSQNLAMDFPEDCAFSVIFGEAYETLDLVAATPDEANIWVTGLSYLIGGNRTPEAIERNQELRDSWLRDMFNKAAGDSLGQLDEFEVMQLVKKLNNGVASTRIRHKFREMTQPKVQEGSSGRPTLSSTEFLELFKEMSTRPEIYFLLVRYSSSEFMTLDDLMIFLEAEQGMTGVTKEKCLALIQRYEVSEEGRQKGYLGIDGFTSYLLSTECDIFDPQQRVVCQDMTQPLSHYFIAASHNTYLTEDQLKGPSSVAAYVSALQKGCRWVELDVWDGANDEPIIYHGHTLTSKILFKAAIEAINQHAFETSDFPVIVSIENHCSVEQQKTMAHYIKSVFGDKLHRGPVDRGAGSLPSPHDLQEKILIKAKKLPDDFDGEEGEVTDEDEGCDTDRGKKIKKEGTKRRTLIKELSDLVALCKSVRFLGFNEARQKQCYWELCSFCESVADKFANMSPEDFVSHNKKFLSRVYPNPSRVDSTNINPQDMWNVGCQIVALNYQTPGLMIDLYDGKFQMNGSCGYILKPAIMREEIAYFRPNSFDVIPGVSPQILHIKIISGQQFPKPRGSGSKGEVIDPYISVEIFGIPADCREERTKTVPHNGYNPIFDESFEFSVNLPELALVRFVVLDDDFIGDEFIGQYTIPFECLQPGYRHITLLSNTGETLAPASLFVHVAVTNKRGGGKPTRRGMSVKKSKKSREYTRMKSIGVKTVDEAFRAASQPLREATDLRENIQCANVGFKESCGLASMANLKQCVRALFNRLAKTTEPVSIAVRTEEDVTLLKLEGNPPEVLKKAIAAYTTLVEECKKLWEQAEGVSIRIEEAQVSSMQYHDNLTQLLTKEGVKGRKLTRATENFAWNIRVMKGQREVLSSAKEECHDWMRQVFETVTSLKQAHEGDIIEEDESR
ncbi:inactive phospholipase C-like protein 2 [Diadema antillarum]|uniref:inactive phospholipase C-like protein 2 n=1 Tax=Diadema antillarum TaxID=105358 RepID=UPI003A8A4164